MPRSCATIVTAPDMDVLWRIIRPSIARSSDDFIIVAVLWILGALATLASIYAVYVINTATSMSVMTDCERQSPGDPSRYEAPDGGLREED
jgi:hypothetical protein